MAGKTYGLWLGLCASALLILGGCLGTGGPSSEVLRLAAGTDDAGPLWHKAGFENPVFYSLPAAAEPPASGFSHQLAPLTYLARRGSKWHPEDISWFTHDVPAALAACGIALTKVQMVQADFTYGGKDQTLNKKIGASPAAAGPTLLFVDDTGPARLDGGGDRGGKAAAVAVIARQGDSSGQTSRARIATRRIARLLGLDPAAAGTSPQDCRTCEFTPRQCALMKAHPLVTKRTGQPV